MKKSNQNILFWALLLFFLIFGIYYLYILEMPNIVSNVIENKAVDLSKMGQFGDSSALLNTLFSGLAFGGVLLTILWQIKNEGSNRQSDRRSQFENIFFNMTQTFEHIIEGLVIKVETGNQFERAVGDLLNNGGEGNADGGQSKTTNKLEEIRGRAVFKYIYTEVKVDGMQLYDSIKANGIDAFTTAMDGTLDHYFRYLYRILKFIDESTLIDEEQKYEYSSMFRAQLSSYELILIYYNGLSKFGKEKLKPLLEKYCTLKNLRVDDVVIVDTLASDGVLSEVMVEEPYSISAIIHNPNYNGNWVKILINTIVGSLAVVILLSTISEFLNDYLFKHIFSLSFFKTNSAALIGALLMFILCRIANLIDNYVHIKVRNCSFDSAFDKFRYFLSYYYDATMLEIVIPLIVSLLYLCGSHDWYGYGFITYTIMIIMYLSVNPLISMAFAAIQMYRNKTE